MNSRLIKKGVAFSAPVLPPGITPVVIVSGSDYEMGYQYGQQVGQYIEIKKDEVWASRLKTRNYDEVLLALKGVQYYVEKYHPELIEQMKGIADGATAHGYKVSYIDVLIINASMPRLDYFNYPADAEKEELPPEKKCSVFSAWGTAITDGSLIGCDSVDAYPIGYNVMVIAFPEKGNNWMGGMEAGTLSQHFCMNNKGLFLGNSGGGGSSRKEDTDYGTNWQFMHQYLMRFANNAIEAKDMTMSWQITESENFHFADVYGNAFVVEATAALKSVRKPGDFGEVDFLFSTNNYLNEAMKPTKEGQTFMGEHGGYGTYSSPRNMMLWDMLHNYHGKIDLEFAKMMWRFPGNLSNPPEGGWDAVICRPTNNRVTVSTPDNGDKGFTYLCTGPVGRVLHSSTDSTGKVMRPTYELVDGTHTFYKVVLAASPAAVVEEALKTAQYDIATAYKEFMQIKVTDPGFAFLNDLFSLTNAEYCEGRNFYTQALLANKGNERMLLFAKAATALTRSQAHAQQLYEALVPPPTDPTMLGHLPFGGNWAEWETRVGPIK